MAYTTFTSAPNDESISLRDRIGMVLSQIAQALFVARGMDARMRQIDELQLKTDAELARMGLKRDDIPSYVFRDILYI